jgi:hypothetical protein
MKTVETKLNKAIKTAKKIAVFTFYFSKILHGLELMIELFKQFVG